MFAEELMNRSAYHFNSKAFYSKGCHVKDLCLPFAKFCIGHLSGERSFVFLSDLKLLRFKFYNQMVPEPQVFANPDAVLQQAQPHNKHVVYRLYLKASLAEIGIIAPQSPRNETVEYKLKQSTKLSNLEFDVLWPLDNLNVVYFTKVDRKVI